MENLIIDLAQTVGVPLGIAIWALYEVRKGHKAHIKDLQTEIVSRNEVIRSNTVALTELRMAIGHLGDLMKSHHNPGDE